MAYNLNAPVFADRYRFEPVGSDWDRGRSGYTHLVYDMKEKRLGVIKRVEIISKEAIEGLKNEVNALRALKGLGVPEVYDTGQAVYGSKNYFYMIIEYIDGIRVERNLNSLDVIERAEMLTQFFGLLAQAHQKGIVNGDVDLKHLFWRKNKKQLVVIDWGNVKPNVDPNKKTEFAYDMARAAEIIFSLVTRQGHPLATGSIALPERSALVAGLGVLPVEFQNLCRWAPRTPSSGAQAPYTAKELFEVSKKWLDAVVRSKPYKPNKKPWLIGILLFGIICFTLLAIFILKFYWPPVAPTMSNLTLAETASPVLPTDTPKLPEATSPTITPIETLISIATPTETPMVSTETPMSLPAPLEHPSSILVFDSKYLVPELKLCWKNEIGLQEIEDFHEGFNRKDDGKWWEFKTLAGRTTEESVTADFGTCSTSPPVNAIALNTWVTQLQPETGGAPGGEFGLFLKEMNGLTREYTLWVDKNEKLHLRIREDDQIVYDDIVLVVSNFQHKGIYSQFLIQIFLEMDNHGSAILYLSEADSYPAEVQAIKPNQMIRVDSAVRPTMDDLQEFGLIGRGGSTQVLIWPLAFLGK